MIYFTLYDETFIVLIINKILFFLTHTFESSAFVDFLTILSQAYCMNKINDKKNYIYFLKKKSNTSIQESFSVEIHEISLEV